MKSICCPVVLILAASVAIAEDATDEKATELEGTWKVVAIQIRDKKAPAEALETMRVVIKGNTMTYTQEKPHPERRSTIIVRPDKKYIDVTPLDGPNKGKLSEGIYKLKDGELTISLRMSLGTGRPKGFAEKGGNLMVLKRVEEVQEDRGAE